MSTQFTIDKNISKEEKYKLLLPQLKELMAHETDLIANLANLSCALHTNMDFFWTGFYRVDQSAQQLILGPFQGPLACTRIPFDKGVCGACYREKRTIVVPNVEEFPLHIACSSESKSEIVIPVFKENELILILDVDSDKLNFFDEIDAHYLEQVVQLI